MVYIIIASIALTLILTGGVFYYTRRRFDRLLDIVTGLLTTTAKMADDISLPHPRPKIRARLILAR